jgi:DNA-binding CsgD family transcriptional regulator
MTCSATRKPELGTLVEHLYASLLDPDALPHFIRGLASAFDSHIVCIQQDIPGSAYLPVSHFTGDGKRTDAIMQAFSRCGIGKNDLMDPGHAHRLIRSGAEHDEGMLPPQQFERLDFYNAVMRPLDMRHSLGFCLHNDAAGRVDVLNVNRSRRRGHYTRDDMELAHRLLPHLRNVHTLQRTLQDLGHSIESLDSIDIPVWLFDANGHVTAANASADRICATPDGLLVRRNGGLHARHKGNNAVLRHAIARAIAPSGRGHHGAVVLHGHDGQPQAVARVHPMLPPAFTPWMLHRPPSAMLTLRLLVPRARAASQILRQAFGLTPAETQLAQALLAHGSLAVCRHTLGRSHETLRTQLKALFVKTGTRRQSELLLKLQKLAS